MEYFKELPAIGRDMGQVLMLVGLTSLLPIAVGLIYQEWDAIPWMAISTAALCGTGFILRFFIPKTDFRPRTSLSVAYTALVWLIVGVFGCFPFLYTGAPLLDCAFESMSAWTGTGFSILPNLDEIPKTLLFWRSLMQWIGALGIVAFTLTIASRSGLVTRNLYRSEGRTESFMPSVIATVFQTWKIYLVLTGISFILILLTGVGVWDSINLALCGIATGGMTIHSAGIPYYNNFALELILIPVMIAGAVPFRLYYAAYVKHSVKEILKDKMLHTIIAIFIFVSAVIIIELKAAGFSLLNAVRQGLFMAGTAVSSTGFQNTDFSGWPIAIIIFISVFLLIGGPQGSTAGGLKIDRIIVMFNTFVWWFKKTMLSSKAVLRMKHNDNTLK
ncbi:MAG TPA: TrkH family potassium uptake protein, partial [Methanocorpusculum sp.]|nr:TrkH family potassium uptake protein [Methanocorpusculum sp.]